MMWDLLKQADIERAQQELKQRRTEILKRHAEELKGLDTDQAEIEALDRLASEFFQKFRTAIAAPAEPAAPAAPSEPMPRDAAPEPEAAKPDPDAGFPRPNGGDIPPVDPRNPPGAERLDGATNFDIFSRAVSNSSF